MCRTPFFIVVISLLLFSCQKKIEVLVLDRNSAFNLELVNFQENVPMLYSKHLLTGEDMRYDSVRDGKMTDDMIKYRISNLSIDVLKLDIPQEDFGFLFKSPELDSIARLGSAYFKHLSVLTELTKKPVAFYAETEYENKEERAKFIKEFIQKNGKPIYSFCINTHFDQCSYEWILEDRTIQIETSYGSRFHISSDGESSSGKYYKLELLIIENKYKNDIYETHVYEFGDSIKYDGQYYTPKDMGFDKKHVFKDDFLLNSTFDKYTNDEYNVYHISNAEDYIEEAIASEEPAQDYVMPLEEAVGTTAVE